MGAAKTVLLVGSYAPSLITFRGAFIAAMVNRGHRVIAVGSELDEHTAEGLEQLGAEPVEFRLSNQSLNPFAMLKAYSELRRLIRQVRPDVLFAYTIKPVVLGGLAGAAEGVPKIVSLITGAGYPWGEGRQVKRKLSRVAATLLYTKALKNSDCVVFQNPDDKALFRRTGMVGRDQKVCLVGGSGVDLNQFNVTPLPERPTFLMVSRLLKAKGVLEYHSAAKQLKREYPDAKMLLVGYRDSSSDSISECELQEIRDDGIEFRGRLSDVRPAIAEASVFVLPSYYPEGTPRSILEAMAMGRAIITTDSPGCRETVVNGSNGYLIARRDGDALHEAMLRFVREPALAGKMGKESRAIAATKFDVNSVNTTLLEAAGL